MIRAAIVEDDPSYARELRQLLARFGEEQGESFEVRTYADGEHIVFDYESKFDLIFLDVEMPRLDGISAAQQLRERGEDAEIIFVTNMAQYAIQGYKVHAWAYILKPVNYYALSLELQGVRKVIRRKAADGLLLTTREGQLRVEIRDVRYIESQKHDIFIHAGGEPIRIRDTLKNLEERLEGFPFERCNNSFLVNLAHVAGVLGEDVLVGGERLPVSRSRRKPFMAAFNSYLGGV